MPAWFDLKSLDPNGEEDASGIKKSADLVERLIKAEIDAGIAPSNIVIGGFSQGGALALYTGEETAQVRLLEKRMNERLERINLLLMNARTDPKSLDDHPEDF